VRTKTRSEEAGEPAAAASSGAPAAARDTKGSV
jgi:hypothetical protein